MKFIKLKAQDGFTLIELTITSVVLSLVVLSIANLFIAIEDTNRQARNIAIAVQLANEKMENYRNRPYSAMTVGVTDFTTSLPATLHPPRSATSTVTEIDAGGLKRVDIAISYTEHSRTKNIQTSTLLARRGINR